MKNRYLTVLLTVMTMVCTAQIQIDGTVKDSLGVALELANVIAINKDTKGLESFGTTNEKGYYKLTLKKNTAYNLQVSYIGLKSINLAYTTKDVNAVKNFTLLSDNTLDAVELVYELPVTISGDTITYNADSYKKQTDRKLGDVLKNIPGVEVNDDGEVEVEGKAVTKLMVNNKDFFDGDTKLGTKNIPANAIDKIEVLKNFAEVGQLKGVQDNSDNIALNIKLKEGKENFWFGDITAGGGVSNDFEAANTNAAPILEGGELYLLQPKLFYYSPKYSINFIGDLNNIGEAALTRRDLRSFSGGFRQPSNTSGTNISLGNNSIGFLAIENNNALDVNNKLAAANFSYSPKKTLDLSGYLIYSNSNVETLENTATVFTNSNIAPNEDTESRTTQKADIALFKLSAKHQPNFKNQLNYDILGRINKNSQTQNFLSSVTGDTNEFEEGTPFSINQNFNYYYTLSAKHIFAVSAQHLWQDEDPFYNALLQNDPANNTGADADAFDNTALGLGFDRTLNTYNISQERRVKTNQLDAKLDYWNVLNTKSNINFTVGAILSRQDFNSDLFQILDDNSIFNATPTINDGLNTNAIRYAFADVYAGLHYQFKTGIFTFRPGFTAHSYTLNNKQFGEEYKDDFFRILPDFSTTVQLKKSETLRLNYRMQTQFNDVNQFARGLVLSNFNSLFVGNPLVENALSHNISLNYSSFNLFNYTNVFGNITYNKTIDQLLNETDFSSVIRTRTPFNSTEDNEVISAFGSFQRTIKKIRGTARANFSYNRFTQIIQGAPSLNKNFNQSYTGQLRTNFSTAPNIQLQYVYSIADNNQGGQVTKFFTKAPSVEFDAYLFKKLTFRTNYSYTSFSNEDELLNSFDFWDATLSYRKNADAKWEYEVKATNLLNTGSRTRTSSSAFAVNVNETFIQPRYITFRVKYQL